MENSRGVTGQKIVNQILGAFCINEITTILKLTLSVYL